MTPSSSIEDRLTREIFESERTRLLMLAALWGALVAIFPALVLAFREDSARIFGTPWALQVLGVFVLLACYELTARHVIARRLAEGKMLPRPLRFVNAFLLQSGGVLPGAILPPTAVGDAPIFQDPDPPASAQDARRVTVTLAVSKASLPQSSPGY